MTITINIEEGNQKKDSDSLLVQNTSGKPKGKYSTGCSV
jgi:hypothetical protein